MESKSISNYFVTHACHVPAVLHLVKMRIPTVSYLINICHSCVALVFDPKRLRVPPPKVVWAIPSGSNPM